MVIKINPSGGHFLRGSIFSERRASKVVSRNYSVGDCLSLKELGQLAKRERKRHGESQEQAAAELNLEQPNVSRAENGYSEAKETLFRLIARYTDFLVDDAPHYCLTKNNSDQ
jgi:ribosome-binding protein aMBF1 (putative translation factor)